MNFQICLCGAAPGYPHAADCPRPLYHGTPDEERAWLAEQVTKHWQLCALPPDEAAPDSGYMI